MTLETVTRTIQFILAPVFMVSTCSVLLGNLLSRYAAINNRLRTLAQERRKLTHMDACTPTPGAAPDASAAGTALRLQEIEAQMPSLLRRHALMRRSVLFFNHAILVFFCDMLVIALASLEATAVWATGASLLVFLVGIALAAVGLCLSTLEARTSHLAVLQDVAWFKATPRGARPVRAARLIQHHRRARANTTRQAQATTSLYVGAGMVTGADDVEHPRVA